MRFSRKSCIIPITWWYAHGRNISRLVTFLFLSTPSSFFSQMMAIVRNNLSTRGCTHQCTLCFVARFNHFSFKHKLLKLDSQNSYRNKNEIAFVAVSTSRAGITFKRLYFLFSNLFLVNEWKYLTSKIFCSVLWCNGTYSFLFILPQKNVATIP